jgi:membrane protein YdbS with pleckstrin-like domain
MSDNNRSGVSLGTVLFLIFLVLKLTNVIDWSWWWVTSPLWISVVIYIILVFLAGFTVGIYKSLNKRRF